MAQSRSPFHTSIKLVGSTLLLALLLSLHSLKATTFLWDGGGTDNNWGTAANWNPNTAPTTGGANQDLQFAGSTRLTPSANGGTAWGIRTITFNSGASAFTLSGTTINIGSGGITNSSSNLQTISNLLNANANQSWAATTGALTVDAVNIATATLTLSGSNAITFGNSGGILTNSGGNRTLRNNASGSVTIGKINLSNDATNRTLDIDGSGTTTVTGVIGNGSGGSTLSALSYSGTGNLILSGANTYGGGTAISSGTVTANNNSAFGTTGTIALSGGTLNSTTSRTISNAVTLSGTANINNITVSGVLTQSGASTTLGLDGATLSNTVNLSQNNTGRTLTVSTGTGTTGTISGVIANGGTGAGNIVKTGDGDLILTNTNTYTGTTTVNQGTLALGASGTISGANLSLAGTGAGGAVLATQGTFSRAFGTGSGAVQLSGTNGAGFAAYGGALNVTTTGTWGTTTGFFTASTGPLIFGDSTLSNNVVTWSGAINLGGATRTITVNDNTGSANDYAIISGVISNGSLIKNGTGLLVLNNAANTYTGTTTVSAGTLNLQSSGAVSGSAGTTVSSGAALELQGGITATNGTLTLNGTGDNGNGALRSVSGTNIWNNSVTLGSDATITSSTSGNLLTVGAWTVNTVTMGSNTLTVDGAGDIKFKANVGASGNSGGFIKNGTGITTFNGDGNYYTGTTTVNAGTLMLDTANNAVPDNSILGNLVIGVGGVSSIADSVLVKYGTGTADNKIANTSQITINADGKLDLNNRTDTIGSLILNGGHVDSGSGLITLNGNVTANANSANRTSLIDGHLDLGGATRTFTVNGTLASDLTINAVVNTGSIIKDGTGTMTLTADNTNGYTGTTLINLGVLNIQDSNALGAHGSSDPLKGTTVANTGAALQLQKNTSDLTIGAEALTLNGTGINNDGALRNMSGSNSLAGTVTLGSNSRINTDAGSLTISGDFTGTTQTLTVGGTSNTTLSGAIGTGTGGIIKDGTGTLTLSGGFTSSFTGGVNVQNGTVILNKTAGLNATGNGAVTIGDNVGGANTAIVQLNQNEQIANAANVTINNDGKLDLNGKTETIGSILGSGTLAIGSGSLIVGDSSNSSFSGAVTGTGLITKEGNGKLTLSSSTLNFGGDITVNTGTLEFTNSGNTASIGGTVTLGAGTTLALNLSGANAAINIDTLHITGNTVIDFGGASASILNVNTLIIDGPVTLVSIINWTQASDFFFSQAWTGATLGTRGVGPETQITFSGYLPSQTAWLTYNHEITPAPEPATYGFILMGAGLALVGYRRRLLKKKSSA